MWPFRRKKPVAPPMPPMASRGEFYADMREMVAMEYDAFQPEHWTDREFAELLSHGGVVQIARRVDAPERIAGYLCASPMRRGWNLRTMSVHPECRRRGVGRELVSRFQRHILRGQRLIADVSELNVDAQLFFKAIGFRVRQVRKKTTTEGSDLYRFRWDQGDPTQWDNTTA